MSVSETFAALGRLLRRTPPPPDDVLEAYAHEVVPVMDRAEWLYQYWLEQSTLFTDSEKLGNVAAIHRWETASMGRSLERVIPPAVLASAHESVLDALDMASRAAQLLSSGSRFHNANAICEGQSLLVQSRDRRLAALQSMRRYLAAVLDAPAEDDTSETRSSGLSEASALVSADADTVQAASAQPEHRPAHAKQPQAALPSEQAPVAASPHTHDVRPDIAPAYAAPVDAGYVLDGTDDGFADDDEAEDGDALPWLTRRTEQEREQTAAPPPPAPTQLPASAPEPAHVPPTEPSTPLQLGEQQAPVAGWGALFRRPAAPPPASEERTPPES